MSNYCKHLYDETTDGYIQIIKINGNKIVKIYNTTNKSLKDVVEVVEGDTNIFLTPNTTYKPERGVRNIRQFRALYIDVDGIEGDQLYVSYKLFELAESGKIPKPTMIVDSGRGIHVYWRIKNAPYGSLYTWQELED
ncbi:MAG: DNA-binding response regulator, partial [Clostridium sp.]